MCIRDRFEIMKKPGRGTNGHIAIGCNNVDRAIYHLSQRGVKFDIDSVTLEQLAQSLPAVEEGCGCCGTKS